MSEVLARLRVREAHGIRRFLYPLTAYVNLPLGTDTSSLQLAPLDGVPVPLQVTLWHTGEYRVDFAVSLAPLQEDTDYLLTIGTPAAIPDPLRLTYQDGDKLSSLQERFQVVLGPAGEIRNVVYDGVSHLLHLVQQEIREDYSAAISRPDPEDKPKRDKRGFIILAATPEIPLNTPDFHIGGGPLAAWHQTKGVYADGSSVAVTTEISACKSWVMLNYRLEQPRLDEIIYFKLPLGGNFKNAITGPTTRTIFDCGINGIYGQADYWGVYINWFAPNEPGGKIRREIGKYYEYNNGEHTSPVNYTGTTSEAEFQQQRWFHLVNERQAVAVAITKMPVGWQSLKVGLRQYIQLEFRLSEETAGPAEFGVCYHFLNDVPAIAAATNPQSILLPPSVEVLPTA